MNGLYKVIRFLLHSSIVKSNHEIGKSYVPDVYRKKQIQRAKNKIYNDFIRFGGSSTVS